MRIKVEFACTVEALLLLQRHEVALTRCQSLAGTLPDEWGGMTSLYMLALATNQLSGAHRHDLSIFRFSNKCTGLLMS
jgi:hypothetical protein